MAMTEKMGMNVQYSFKYLSYLSSLRPESSIG